MTNKEKFLSLVSKEETPTVERAKARLARKNYTKLSHKIAITILTRLDELGWRQVTLADKMGVSAQQVNKWVKGKENFTIETLVKLSDVLGVDLMKVSTLKEDSKKQVVKYRSSEIYTVSSNITHLKLQITRSSDTAYENNYQTA
ncbi:helix-turn-helix transcriptional regulator [Flavobacterium sp. JP2137]|uniref:helix-turn-helix transcriptional regulator n=1 Tax=Flavobacterium sp. JP2137 TaxID=3414510 RepID=UPI003D300847